MNNLKDFLSIAINKDLPIVKRNQYFTGVGNASWISSQSIINILFSPLSLDNFSEMMSKNTSIENQYQAHLNNYYKLFLQYFNGAILFSGNINFYGFSQLKAIDFNQPPSIFQINQVLMKSPNYISLVFGSAFDKNGEDIYFAFDRSEIEKVKLIRVSRKKEILLEFENFTEFFIFLNGFCFDNFSSNGKIIETKSRFKNIVGLV